MSGPIAPNTFEPPRLFKTSLAANVPAPILIMSCLFVLKALDNVFKPPCKSPLINYCAACPAFAASKNANPAPVSNKLTEKDLFLRAVRFLPRLATMFVLVGALPTEHPVILIYG